ncbi:HEPN domain-containing protein, partial [Candidatus Poribacteria bacterium]|nr:HEPN domain-containing protein [Candidatus Poribacteria bacterium]
MDDLKKIAIERWLQKANNDLRTAETMLRVDPPTTDTMCFHAQQYVEKSLKAYLVHIDQHVEKTHYLPRL